MVPYVDVVVAVTVNACTVVCVACVYAVRVTAVLEYGWMRCSYGDCRACEWYTWFRYFVLCI